MRRSWKRKFWYFLNGGSGGEDSLMEKGANSRDYTKQREDWFRRRISWRLRKKWPAILILPEDSGHVSGMARVETWEDWTMVWEIRYIVGLGFESWFIWFYDHIKHMLTMFWDSDSWFGENKSFLARIQMSVVQWMWLQDCMETLYECETSRN